MKRSGTTVSMFIAGALSIGAIAATCLVSSPAAAQEVVVVEGPPPEVIATYRPVYYEGRAHYWHNGYWHYRTANGGWGYHRVAPVYFNAYRDHYYHRYGWRR